MKLPPKGLFDAATENNTGGGSSAAAVPTTAELEAKLKAEQQRAEAAIKAANEAEAKAKEAQAKADQAAKEAQEHKQNLEAIRKAKTASGEVDVENLIKEVASTARAGAESASAEKIAALNKRVESLDAEARRIKLDAVKQQVIASAKGRIVAELVTGDTEESIVASGKSAMAAFERIASEVKGPGNTNSGVPPTSHNQVPPPIVSGAPAPTGDPTDIKSPANMSPQEWLKHREATLAQVRAKYK